MNLPTDWTVQHLMSIDHTAMAAWIRAIPFEEWPQQYRERDGSLRPAMVTDLNWYGFGTNAGAVYVTSKVMSKLLISGEVTQLRDSIIRLGGAPPLPYVQNYMLSVVMPGRSIEPHTDDPRADQPGLSWFCRVHVPLLADDLSQFIVDGEPHTMRPGEAYLVNVRRRHEVRNNGTIPRIHYMFDVYT